MSLVFDGKVVVVSGDCGVEEAETLMNLVQGNPDAPVDVSRAGLVHTALWQILIAFSPQVVGDPCDPVVRQWLMPILVSDNRNGVLT